MKGSWAEPFNQVADVFRAMRSGTAMAPFLLMNFIAALVTVPCVIFGGIVVQIFGLIMFGGTVLVTAKACLYFMVNDPKRLGTEEHEVRTRILDIFAGDEKNTLHVNADHYVAIVANPRLPGKKEDNIALPSGAEKQPSSDQPPQLL